MKKLLAVLTALLPVIYAGSLYATFLLRADDDILFVILGVYPVISFLISVLYCILTAKAERKFLAVGNVWFYVGNILLLLSEIALWIIRYLDVRIAEQNGDMEGGLGLALLILLFLPHWISYLFIRVTGAINCARSLKGIRSTHITVLYAGMQLFPIADLISAVLVLREVNHCINPISPPRA